MTPIHNLCILGKDGVGKSKLVDQLLHLAEQRPTSLLAETPEETERGYTLFNRFYHLNLGESRMNLIDTPGNSNFLPKVLSAMQVTTGAVLVVAGSGAAMSALRLWEAVVTAGKPRVIFLNQLDQPEANWENSLHEVESQFGVAPLVLTLPHYDDGQLVGIAEVLTGSYFTYPKGVETPKPLPRAMQEELSSFRETAWEALADLDDEVMGMILEGQAPSPELLTQALNQGIKSNKITPLLLGSAASRVGVAHLHRFLSEHFPPHHQGPLWVGTRSGDPETEIVELRPQADQPFSGLCFKTLNDRFKGRLSFVLVVSGELHRNMELLNSSTGNRFSLSHFARIHGEELEELESAFTGEIVVIEKEESLFTQQTLCNPKHPVCYHPISLPVPRCTFHLELENSNQDVKTMEALHRLMEEDPALRLHKNEETGELLLSGMGVIHLQVVQEQLQRLYNVTLKLTKPFIAYHETPTQAAQAQGKHKKQSGGHGQFGNVNLVLEPQPRGAGFEFKNEIVGGVIPKQYIPAIEKGVLEALKRGSLGGFPVVDLRVRLVDGSHHVVDSNDFSFFQAAILAIREALPRTNPVLLEPVMAMEIDIPEEDLGKVTKDISARRGRVGDYSYQTFTTMVHAHCPLAELGDYAPALRGMTQGRGLFSMHLASYEVLTSHLSKKILEGRKAQALA